MAVGDISQGLAATVRDRLGAWATLGLADATIYRWLTVAQYDLLWRLHEGHVPEHSAVATGTLTASAFSLPADFLRERALFIGTVEAKRWNVSEQETLGTALSTPTVNAPYYYIWHDGTSVKGIVMVGDAASTAAYTLYYVKRPPTLSASVDPTLNASLHDMLVQYAIIRARELRREYEEWVRIQAWRGWSLTQLNSRFMPGLLAEGVSGDPAERTRVLSAKGGYARGGRR